MAHPLLSRPLLIPAVVDEQQREKERAREAEQDRRDLAAAAAAAAQMEVDPPLPPPAGGSVVVESNGHLAMEMEPPESASTESTNPAGAPDQAPGAADGSTSLSTSSSISSASEPSAKFKLSLTLPEQEAGEAKPRKRKRSAAPPPIQVQAELVPAGHSAAALLSPGTLKRQQEEQVHYKAQYAQIMRPQTTSADKRNSAKKKKATTTTPKSDASPNKRPKAEAAESTDQQPRRRAPVRPKSAPKLPAATATPPSNDDGTMSDGDDSAAAVGADVFVKFPAADEVAWHAAASDFDQPFDEFQSTLPHAPALPTGTRTTRAPASQLLHVTRLQIYRELSEAYFGRFMKDTPDYGTAEDEQVRIEKGASRASSRVKTTVAKRETPEQLRMIFCEQLNKCEADRVASSAGVSEKTGIVMVAPLAPSQQLKSLGASDAASVRKMMDDRAQVPPTLDDYRLSLLDESNSPPPPIYPINPNFDLFQYAPWVAHDQYEEVHDDLTHRAQQNEDEHPTLPAATATLHQQDDAAANASASASVTASASSGATAVHSTDGPNYNQFHPSLDPLGSPAPAPPAAAAAAEADGFPSPSPSASKDIEMGEEERKEGSTITTHQLLPTVIELSDGPFHATATVRALPTQASDGEGVAGPSTSLLPPPAAVAADATMSPAESPRAEQSDEQPASNGHTPPSMVGAMGEPTRAAIAAADLAAASGQSATLPPAGSAPASIDRASSAPPAGASSLPATAHGVGMMASLDFNSELCVPWKQHWTMESFSWKFDNHTRTFVGGAYDPANRRHNDVQLATGLIQTAQKAFHQAMVDDEKEEAELANKIHMRMRDQRHKKVWPDGDAPSAAAPPTAAAAAASVESTPSGASDDLDSPLVRGGHGYPVDSPEYAALRARISASFEFAQAHSLFLPHTYLRTVAPRLHERAIRMSQECVAELERKFALPPDERSVDGTFGLVVPGFGCQGTQVFLKIGLCVTMLHDEIGFCSALNYMTVRSRGCALWIGLNMHKASVKWSKDRLRYLIHEKKFNLAHFMAELRKAGLQPSMQLQLPGMCIYSPSGRGSAHIVVTVGQWVEQIAINHSLSPRGLQASMAFWDGVEPLLHNSALATRCVIPIIWLTKHRQWDLGLDDQVRVLTALEQSVRAEGKYELAFRDYDNPNDQELYCRHCFGRSHRAILYMRIDGYCPACFADINQAYHHFGTMIDRRFK